VYALLHLIAQNNDILPTAQTVENCSHFLILPTVIRLFLKHHIPSIVSEYLNQLNPSQREAVEHQNGPIMVIAGAGSGKTRVLTYRIAHLIEKGVDPFNILALTFTNKAAKEMKERIGQIIGHAAAKNLWMGTFHSVFSKILRFEAELLNYPSNFTIYDTADTKNLIKSIVKELNLDPDIYKPNAVYSRISQLKNALISPDRYLSNSELQMDDAQRKFHEMGKLYKTYQKRLFTSGSMDFDDLLFNTYVLLRDFPEVLNKYQNKFKYLLVDEYQDTNHVQYMIVKRLAAMHENICVVGDDAQSIYAFRGANIQNILNFKVDYPDFKTVKLEENYRSTQTIVEAANSLIKFNKKQIEKKVFTQNPQGAPIKVIKTMSDNEEGYMVAHSIFDIQMNQQAPFKDFAILYRTNAQSRALEEALRKRNIPYKIYGGLSFYQRKEVKDLLAYFRLMINPQDEEALKRIINYPTRGIGNTTLQKLIIAANHHNQPIYEVIANPLFHKQLGVNSGTLNKLHKFVTMIQSFQAQLDGDAYTLAENIAKMSGILSELHKDKTPEGVSRYDNIQELLNAIKDFSEEQKKDGKSALLSDFMQDVALLTDADNDKKEDTNKVSLMTIHAAKGLEFPYIYIVGMEENLFPSQMSVHSREDLEEERRLFYVALTRAEKFAQLSYATSRYRWGQLIDCEASRFLQEIDECYLDWHFQRQKPKGMPSQKKSYSYKINAGKRQFAPKRSVEKKAVVNTSPKFTPRNLTKANTAVSKNTSGPDNSHLLQAGMLVEHAKFGAGKILQIEGSPGNQKATVFFKNVGQKQLLLKFAKLTIIK
jgi:DNA helicase-2/ATP-dependent DNA helicase PcrA